jgi:hypothetical protein
MLNDESIGASVFSTQRSQLCSRLHEASGLDTASNFAEFSSGDAHLPPCEQ